MQNLFDVVVVVCSWIAVAAPDAPGIGLLRLLRAFRVFRLFRRVRSLLVIIEGVVASMPGVSNAFVVLIIFMGIWSIIGVQFFGTTMGDEFGSFSKAMFTLWQVMTGDNWSPDIARPLMRSESVGAYSAPYFVSYTFVASIVMANVVIAVLLDKYLKSTAESAMRTEEGMHGLATSRRSLRTRLVCIVWMLRIGRATYKRQRIAALRLQRAVAHWLRRMRRQRDRPERVAVRLLRGVVAQTIESVYSEREMAALDHRTRLGVLVAIWTNRTTRQLALNQFVICTEAHAKAARLGSHAALVHLIMALVVKQSATDALQRNPGAAAQS